MNLPLPQECQGNALGSTSRATTTQWACTQRREMDIRKWLVKNRDKDHNDDEQDDNGVRVACCANVRVDYMYKSVCACVIVSQSDV